MVYEIRCAWCGRHIGIKEGPDNRLTMAMKTGEPSISHGICRICKDNLLKDIRDNNDNKKEE